jgi:hypothetical protein
MSRLQFAAVVAILMGVGLWVDPAAGQQITAAAPLHGVGDSFFERTGAHWGLQGKGWSLSFGGIPAAPIADPAPPGGGIQGGFRFGQPGLGGSFGFVAEQGAQRSLVGHTPGLTTLNAVPGVVWDVSYSPFVMGVYPVVGGFPESLFMASPGYCPWTLYAPTYPLARVSELPVMTSGRGIITPPDREAGDRVLAGGAAARVSIAKDATGRTAPSVAEAQRLLAEEQAAQGQEGQKWFDRGVEAEQSGNLGAARICYQMASRRLTGDLKDRALARLASLK